MAMTAKELLALKTDFIKRRDETVDIQIKDIGTWTFNVPNSADILDATVYRDEHYQGQSSKLDSVLVFRQVKEPNLYDNDLIAGLGEVAGISDAKAGDWEVEVMLKPGQIQRISSILMEKAGYTADSAVASVEAKFEAVEAVKKQ